MERISSGDAEICFDIAGSGPPVVLLHPFRSVESFGFPWPRSYPADTA